MAANQGQDQQVITDVQTKTTDEIRKQGLDPKVFEKIQADKAEMDRMEKEIAEKIKGNYISFKDDKEKKVLLFSGKYQKDNVPAKDFATGKIIENKFVQKWRFECYDVTDQTNPNPEVSIWERGWREAKVIMHFLGERKAELVIVRNGAKGSNTTTYLIYPK